VVGIYIEWTSKHFVIKNCYVDAGTYGLVISFVGVGTATITNNTVTNNDYGIYLSGSDSNSVSANNCSYNSDTGIYLYSSTTNSVSENNCSYNNYGISLDGSSNDNSVSANNCSYNVNNGITLAGSSNGNSVSENNCSYNDYGINLLRSNTTSIIENFLQYNDDYGVRITSLSFSNLIYKNSFDTNNLGGTSQAYDDGADNHWFHILFSRGNYWSDWNGSEYYYIDGSANSFDPYPIEYPQTPPTITAVSHDPSNPTELDTITISATVTDLSGVDIVTLKHRINGGLWADIAMTLSTGSLYQVTIGPFTEGSVIEYYIYAEDNSSNHNEAIEDNFGAYYSFTVSVDITEFSSLSPLLLLSLSLLLLVTVPILYKRKRT
jgi:parallel beta-helix repeat protein